MKVAFAVSSRASDDPLSDGVEEENNSGMELKETNRRFPRDTVDSRSIKIKIFSFFYWLHLQLERHWPTRMLSRARRRCQSDLAVVPQGSFLFLKIVSAAAL